MFPIVISHSSNMGKLNCNTMFLSVLEIVTLMAKFSSMYVPKNFVYLTSIYIFLSNDYI